MLIVNDFEDIEDIKKLYKNQRFICVPDNIRVSKYIDITSIFGEDKVILQSQMGEYSYEEQGQ